jgi:hypothetical protein
MIEEPFVLPSLQTTDLTGTLSDRPDPVQLFAKGTIVSWDSSIRRGTLSFNGAIYENLSVLDTPALASLAVNDVVLLLKMNRSWLIVGRILDPL